MNCHLLSHYGSKFSLVTFLQNYTTEYFSWSRVLMYLTYIFHCNFKDLTPLKKFFSNVKFSYAKLWIIHFWLFLNWSTKDFQKLCTLSKITFCNQEFCVSKPSSHIRPMGSFTSSPSRHNQHTKVFESPKRAPNSCFSSSFRKTLQALKEQPEVLQKFLQSNKNFHCFDVHLFKHF